MLTDTTFWIDVARERRARRAKGPAGLFLAKHRAHSLSISVITWGELAAGFDDMQGIEMFLRRIHVHSLPLQVAWTASRIERKLRSSGRLGENDNWIAATALAKGLPLVTNDRAFNRVPGLRVVPY